MQLALRFGMVLAIVQSVVLTSSIAEDDTLGRQAKFLDYWISSSLESNFVGEDDEHIDHFVKGFYHKAFYYWLASHGPNAWIEPLPTTERWINKISKIAYYRTRIENNWDPAELVMIREGKAPNFRDEGDSFMPGISLEELGDAEAYQKLVSKFRSEMLGFKPTPNVESGRNGD